MKNCKKCKGLISKSLAVAASFIWGSSFVAQMLGADKLNAVSFNALRSITASAVLIIGYGIYNKLNKRPFFPKIRKELIMSGITCGLSLFIATTFQQIGIAKTSVSETSFVTATYNVLVPILLALSGKKPPRAVWPATVISVIGLYFLCITDGFSLSIYYIFLIISAFGFAFQIIFINQYNEIVDGMEISIAQFSVNALLGTVIMLFVPPTFSDIVQSAVPILYCGVLSSALAYTLQIFALKGTDSSLTSMLLSLESVFGALSGAVLLHEQLSLRKYIGCALILLTVILVQLPEKKER